MTVQYDGNNLYTFFIGDRTLTLSQSEIDEIQSYDFETGLESSTVSELNDKIENLEYDIRDLTKTLEDTREDLEDTENKLEDALYEIRQLQKELE